MSLSEPSKSNFCGAPASLFTIFFANLGWFSEASTSDSDDSASDSAWTTYEFHPQHGVPKVHPDMLTVVIHMDEQCYMYMVCNNFDTYA